MTTDAAPSQQISLPQWLERAVDDIGYQEYVYSELADRERDRSYARKVSRGARSKRQSLFAFIFSNDTTPDPSYGGHYDIRVGTAAENLPQNRYSDITPFDRTRVTVSVHGHPEERYLNANWVRELYGGQWWIAAQAPLPNTAHAFLALFVQGDTRPPPQLAPKGYDPIPGGDFAKVPCRVRVAVQLTKSIEKGTMKAHPYFPDKIGDDESFIIPAPKETGAPGFKVTLVSEENLQLECCIKSIVRVVECNAEAGKEPHHIHANEVEETGTAAYFTHLLYTRWPDFGVPDGPEEKAGLLSFARLVEQTNLAPPPFHPEGRPYHPYPPKTVNCSAGVGRTGAFLALTSLLRAHGMLLPGSVIYPETTHELARSPLGPLPDEMADDEVANEIDSLREQRPSMVQNPRQMSLVYELTAAVYHEAEARREAEVHVSRSGTGSGPGHSAEY